MPNIVQFDAGQLGFRGSDMGAEAAAGAARRVGALYSQRAGTIENVGQRIGRGIAAAGEAAGQQIEHEDISSGAADGMALLNELTNGTDPAKPGWNTVAKNASPTD